MASENPGAQSALANNAATPALANYLSDHFAMLKFEAYLSKMVITIDYGGKQERAFDAMINGPAPDSAVAQMTLHRQYLDGMTFCRGVNSFQTYLSNLLTMMFEARPEMLKSQKKVTREFCVEHHAANDLISALAEQTVNELVYQSLNDLADFFRDSLKLPLFTDDAWLREAAFYVDLRNIVTHNRGIVNRFFLHRHPDFPGALGSQIVFEDNTETGHMVGALVYFARDLDARAIAKFALQTIPLR